MKKIKLLLAAAALMIGGSVSAQTDVTSTYITNPSFETDGNSAASNANLTITGWTEAQSSADSFNNTQTRDKDTDNASAFGTKITPADGTYYLFYRHGWNGDSGTNATFTTTTKSDLPAGVYMLQFKYQQSYNEDSSSKTKTRIKLAAKNGDTEIASVTTGDATKDATFGDDKWSTSYFIFKVDAATSVDFVFTLYSGGQKRSDFLLDDVKLIYWAIPSSPWATGEFYLKNVAEDQFLSAGHSWGTHSDLNDVPMSFIIGEESKGYTLESRVSNGGTSYYLGINNENAPYCDQGKQYWIVKEVSTGVYAFTKDGTNYLASNGASAELVNTATSITDAACWTLVTKAEYLASAVSSATKASPVSVTALIKDQNFGRNNRDFSSWSVTSGGGDAKKAGGNDNMNWQQWNATFDITQTVSGLPNGLYSMKVQGFYRPGANDTESTTQRSFIYAGDEAPVAIQLVSSDGAASADADKGLTTENTNTGSSVYVPNSQGDASKAFSKGLYDDNQVLNILVTDGTLTIGAKCDENVGNAWTVIDNFRLYYYGATISTAAVALPDGGAMTAGTWYYFDIPADGSYDLTLTTLGDIVYTTDTKILVEDASSVTANFAKTSELDLTAGRYFVKSASAQTFTVTAHTFTYALGDATLSAADGSYIQNRIVTVTFPDAATNDPDGSTALVASSKATVNGVQVALSAVTNGFSLDLEELVPGAGYAITIPAGVYGYEGQSMNSAISLILYAPEVFDGFYFLRSTAGKYVARGGDYNSRAVVDEFGLPLSVATNASGITQFTFVDNGGKLFLNGSGNAYTDAASPADWTLQATAGGYYLIHANEGDYKDKKLTVWSGDNKSLFAGNDGSVFAIEPVSEHNTYMEALKDAQAATAATAAGNGAITTKSALAAWLAENYDANVVSVPAVSFTEKWNGNASAEWGAGKDMYTNTISDLPAGLYKLTVNAYYRLNGSATAADGARGNTYLYGGTAKTQLYSLKDFPAAEAWAGRNQSDAAGYYPDDVTSGTAATASSYLTELYVYHEGGDFTYGIHQPSRFSNGEWFGYQNFTLTCYEKAAATMAIGGAKYATFVAPFDVTIPSGVEAYKILTATGSTLNLTAVETTIPANTPVVLYSESAVNETFYGKTVDGTPTVGLLTGVYAETPAEDGWFVLQKNDDVVGFYKVNTSVATPSVPANRAYLQTDGGTPVKAFFFGGGEDAIKSVFDGVAAGEVYDLNGRKVAKMQKGGTYVVNGKTVIVK